MIMLEFTELGLSVGILLGAFWLLALIMELANDE